MCSRRQPEPVEALLCIITIDRWPTIAADCEIPSQIVYRRRIWGPVVWMVEALYPLIRPIPEAHVDGRQAGEAAGDREGEE